MAISGISPSVYQSIVDNSNSLLKQGAKGQQVKDLQKALAAAGFSPGAADGDFGPKTKAAVRAFQDAHGLSPDGIVGPKTWAKLAEVTQPSSAAPAPSTGAPVPTLPTRMLKQGSSGPDVTTLQSALNQLGHSAGTADGKFGPKTAAAVKSFQRAHGLTADGIVGNKTWAAMAAALAGEADSIGPAQPPVEDVPTPGGTGVGTDEPSFVPPNVTLRSGDTGAHVKTLQRALASHGFSVGSVDGQFGPKTKAAVRAFQSANGLSSDGVVGPRTWAALSGNAAAPVTAPPTVDGELHISPTGYVFPILGYVWHSGSGGYGYKKPASKGGHVHNGVDIGAYRGTPMVSPVEGEVIRSGWNDTGGWRITIRDEEGNEHYFAHLDQESPLQVGDTVDAGTPIGAVGRTGNASGGGPHLHYSIKDSNGNYFDPMPWLYATGGTNVSNPPSDYMRGY